MWKAAEIIFLPVLKILLFFPVKSSSTHHAILQSEHLPTLQSFLLASLDFENLPCLGLHPILLSLCHRLSQGMQADLVPHHHRVSFMSPCTISSPCYPSQTQDYSLFHTGHHGGCIFCLTLERISFDDACMAKCSSSMVSHS